MRFGDFLLGFSISSRKQYRYNKRINGNRIAFSLLKIDIIKHTTEPKYKKTLLRFKSTCFYLIYKTIDNIKNKAESVSALEAI